jgi:hypothetical protein
MKNTQLVLVECRNCAPYVYKVVSDKPITLNNVVRYFEETEGWNEDRDSITFIDEVTEIDLDQQLVED